MGFQGKVEITAAAIAFAVVSGSSIAFAGEVYSTSGVAISGYDPISYFADHQAVKGSDRYTANYQGVTFRFASMGHRDTFLKDPRHYAPQYGGFCGYAVALGHKAPTDPQAFAVVGNKLYLNYSPAVLKTWRQDQARYITQANTNWPTVKRRKD